MEAIGIDIGGTGIKGAVVDLSSGTLLTERFKISTPEGGKPADILETVATLYQMIIDVHGKESLPVGVCFPSVIRQGHTLTAANISPEWVGLDAERMFESKLSTDIHFVNDADAAGVAEVKFGSAKDIQGVAIMLTLGTGIGSALIHNGELVPNTEFGHIIMDGVDAEKIASSRSREKLGLDYQQWAEVLSRFLGLLTTITNPDLYIFGGGVIKNHELLLPYIKSDVKIVPALLRNNSGIIGAASLAI